MSPWVLRGLRDGVVTTRWPDRPDPYADGWRGPATVARPAPGRGGGPGFAVPDRRHHDRRRWLRPARSGPVHPVRALRRPAPGRVRLVPGARRRGADPPGAGGAAEPARPSRAWRRSGPRWPRRTTALRRSVHLRHVDAGSDGAEEQEIAALLDPVYDIHRLGIFFTASPRHADVLLVDGCGRARDGGAAPPYLHGHARPEGRHRGRHRRGQRRPGRRTAVLRHRGRCR